MIRHVLPLIALLLFTIGCNTKPATYPVSGTVKFADGTPLTGGSVEFRNITDDITKQVNARGEIGPDGKFQLTTFAPNDGALAGEHQVCIFPPSYEIPSNLSSEPPPNPLQRKFMAYETSELQYNVTAKGPNEFHIDLGQKAAGSK